MSPIRQQLLDWAFWVGSRGGGQWDGFLAQFMLMGHGNLLSIALFSSRLAVFSLLTGIIRLS